MGEKRRDIQGLRALAVLLVVAFHLWPDRITGGYVGVDIFFVISGYLITAHLLREVDHTGSVDLRSFWARRIMRLLPAAFTVLAASGVAAYFILPKGLLLQALREIAASALYVQNWALAGSSVDYLAAENEPSLVQHFWSLSVEEQFYILWPVVIVVAVWAAARVRRAGVTSRLMIAIALSLVFATSLAYSVYATAESQASAYFFTTTRAWEFAAGGLLAMLPALRGGWESTPGRRAFGVLAGWGGFGLILFAAFGFGSQTPFPGSAALAPVIGAALLLYFGESQSGWAPSYFSRSGPAQFLGDISYSVYLWHWPLIILYPYARGSEMRMNGALVVLATTLALAWLTKVLVEDPFRWRPRFRSRRLAYGFAAAGMAFLVAGSSAGVAHLDSLYAQARVAKPAFASKDALAGEIEATLASDEWAFPDQLPSKDAQAKEWVEDGCLTVDASDLNRCTYGDPAAARTAVVLGDSIASSYLPAIRGALESQGWKVIPLTYGQCPAADVAVNEWGKTEEYTACKDHRAWVAKTVPSLDADLVILASAGTSSYARLLSKNTGAAADAEWSAGVLSFTRKFTGNRADVVVLGSPVLANCVTGAGMTPELCRPTASPVDEGRVRAESAAAAEAGARYVDTREWMCSSDLRLCPEQIGPALVRADTSHLSDTFSTRLSLVMRAALLG